MDKQLIYASPLTRPLVFFLTGVQYGLCDECNLVENNMKKAIDTVAK